jgi:hypothetical protein
LCQISREKALAFDRFSTFSPFSTRRLHALAAQRYRRALGGGLRGPIRDRGMVSVRYVPEAESPEKRATFSFTLPARPRPKIQAIVAFLG